MTDLKINNVDNFNIQDFQYGDVSNNFELLPVRCFSCGYILGDKYERYMDFLKRRVSPELALNEMKIMRTCCRGLVQNPPQIPLSLSIGTPGPSIVSMFKGLLIDEKTANSITRTTANTEIINATGDPYFNPKPLTSANKPSRIYNLSAKKEDYTFDINETAEVELGQFNSDSFAEALESENLEFE
jgi:DNA-directed RNA polymerase subunit N (RpoN/RPB10)